MADTVHLFVFDGFADREAAFAVAGINTPEFQREPGRYQFMSKRGSATLLLPLGGRTTHGVGLGALHKTGKWEYFARMARAA